MSILARRVGYLLALVMVGCNSPPPAELQCPARIFPALRVSVVDAETSQPLDESIVISTLGTRVDTLVASGGVAIGPDGISGVFVVRVEKPGYLAWEADGVEVEEGDCGPNTVFLTARLDKS